MRVKMPEKANGLFRYIKLKFLPKTLFFRTMDCFRDNITRSFLSLFDGYARAGYTRFNAHYNCMRWSFDRKTRFDRKYSFLGSNNFIITKS